MTSAELGKLHKPLDSYCLFFSFTSETLYLIKATKSTCASHVITAKKKKALHNSWCPEKILLTREFAISRKNQNHVSKQSARLIWVSNETPALDMHLSGGYLLRLCLTQECALSSPCGKLGCITLPMPRRLSPPFIPPNRREKIPNPHSNSDQVPV